MYLQNADSYSNVIAYGVTPMIELMRIFEEEMQEEFSDPKSRGAILWTEIRGKALAIEAAMERLRSKS
jgi:hypothetical protein